MPAVVLLIPPIVEGLLWIAGGAAVVGTAHQTMPGKQEREQAIGRLFEGERSPSDEAMMMEGARDDADSGADRTGESAGADANQCIGDCRRSRDRCAGLRRQVQEHEEKLRQYKANPYAHDNNQLLGQGRDEHIIATRIRSLEGQIDNFKRLLRACEERNRGR